MAALFQSLSPALIYLAAALVLPLSPNGHLRALFLLIVPTGAFASFALMPYGDYGQLHFMGFELIVFRLDALSWLFGLAFSIAGFIAFLYAFHLRDTVQQVATLLYAGAAIGAVFAGDLVTLFIFWEMTALSSVLLIWARRTDEAYRAGMRYLLMQIGSGVLLFAGLTLLYRETGSIAFHAMAPESPGTWMILIAFGIKAAFPLLNNWLTDAYPAATITGAVALSSFTTKLAIYALARGFPGSEILIPVGLLMALMPLPWALAADDLRKALAYLLNNQLGFMVVGIGIGTPLALNGVAAHAFAHIIYDGLMFMALGAVLYRTGTIKASELGSLHRQMPWTAAFILFGGLSFSALPFTSGFVTKSLTFSAAEPLADGLLYTGLMVASAGVFMVAVMKMGEVFFTGTPVQTTTAPLDMRLAMGISAALCIGIGVAPQLLYRALPFDTPYNAYTLHHVAVQLAVLGAGGLVWLGLRHFRLLPRTPLPDTDLIFRLAGPALVRLATRLIDLVWGNFIRLAENALDRALALIYRATGPNGPLARTWPSGSMVLWIAALLGATLLLNYL